MLVVVFQVPLSVPIATPTKPYAFTKIIGMMYDAGKGLGSSIRRLGENNLCPLE